MVFCCFFDIGLVMRHLYSIIAINLFLSLTADSQVFSNQNTVFGIDAIVSSNLFGAGVSFFDFDDDGRDDLTYVLDDEIRFYRNNNGICTPAYYDVTVSDNAKHPTWVDFDNDGDNDLFITQYMNYNKLYRNDGNMQMVDVTLQAGLGDAIAPHFGSCWGDYDRDGDLDVYCCSYIFVYNGSDEYNYWDKLYRNNGDGTFTDVSISAGISDGINSTFQAVWLDYDHDLWPDLYTINDKLFPNLLYHNNGDGTFTEVGEAAGASIAEVDAMTASCADMDNDGWEDIFVSNTSIGPCALLKNNGNGTFTDVAATSGMQLNVLAWAGNWMDYDLDMDQDIYVCEYFPTTPGLGNKFMRNTGNANFVNVNSVVFPFDFSDSYTCASGDWNDDGYPDLTVSNIAPQNANMWLNSGGTKNYLKISVQGTISNRDAIGTRIVVWTNGTQQMRYTRCGENYMGQDSDDEIFGLGDHTTADSIIFHWPSGIEERLFGVPSNQHIHLIEGSVFTAVITASPGSVICPGDSVVLDAGDYMGFLWDDGSTDQFRVVYSAGEYSVEVTNAMGFTSIAEITIEAATIPGQSLQVGSPTCFGMDDGWIELSTGDSLASVVWNGITPGAFLNNLDAGTYSYAIVFSNGCEVTGEALLPEPDSLYVDFLISPALCNGEASGAIQLAGTNAVNYLLTWNDGTLEGDLVMMTAGIYTYLLQDEMGCTTMGNIEVSQPDPIVAFVTVEPVTCHGGVDGSAQIELEGGTAPFTTDWAGNDPFQLPADLYFVAVMDAHGCEVVVEIEVAQPEELSAEAIIECDNDLLSIVLNVDGGTAPYSASWSNGSTGLQIEGLDEAAVVNAIVTDDHGCSVELESLSCALSAMNIDEEVFECLPNPSSSEIRVRGCAGKKIQVFDGMGRTVMQWDENHPEPMVLAVSSWAPGCYLLIITGERGTRSAHLVVND